MRILKEMGLTRLALGQRQEAVAPLEQALELSRRRQIETAPERAEIAAALRRAGTK
jgi:hypothetical protein